MRETRTGRRAASAAIAAALIATLTLAGAVAAKDHPTKPEKAHPVKSGQTQGGAGGAGGGGAKVTVEKPVSLKVKGNASHPGSVFRVNAVLKSARDVRPETMEAVVHFATGDVTVELTRQGGGAAYHAWVPVPEDEPEGVVLIDATAEVDGETVEASGAGKILDRGEGDEEEVTEPELVEPDASPETCEPESSPDPSPSGDPEPSPSASAEASPSAEASASTDPEPSPSDDGDGDESPDPSSSPDAEETAEEDCDSADDDGTQLTMAVLARIIAFVESLMA